MGKKGTSKREKNGKKHGFVHLHFFCIYFAFSNCLFCFVFAFCLEKSKKKVKRKSKIHAKEMQIDKSIFVPMFPLFDFPCFPLVFHVSVLLCFLDFADLLFGCSFLFFAFVAFFFQVLIKLE